ncbi:MAG: IS21 family transposase, partial [Ilumatobacteraceae bacterium]|nr:IS21 family transposase [Ilumatobacteraceae bacterium]
LTVLDYLEIRKAHASGESMNSIARRLGHCQKAVSRAIHSQTGEPLPYTRTKPVGYPKLGPFVAIIDQILGDDESAPRKQRHHAKRIYQRLKSEHGYAGSYYPVRRYVASLRQSSRETFMRLDHVPGRRMEFDFGRVAVDYPDGRRTTDVLSGVWTFSNCPFLIALPSQRSESILEGMKSAFEFFGCVPREVWWDNPRAVAIEILRGRDRTLNPAYASLASHYRFDPLFCMPRKGQEKSDVEQSVFALERRACTPVPKANDLAELNRQLLAFCLAERDRIVAHQSATIGVNFESEKAAAMALPAHRFDACVKRGALVDKYQTVVFETNRYSVPHGAAFAKVTVKAYVERVAVVHKGEVVAEHRRGYGRHESFIDPLHFVAALARKPAWLTHVPAMRDWKLPESFGRLRKTFKEHLGPRTGERHYIRVLQLLTRHPATRIERVIEMLIHKPTTTAELIAQAADRLVRGDDAGPSTIDTDQQNERIRRVQVPMPDLRQFDRLLSANPFNGEPSDECDELRECKNRGAADDAAAAPSQNTASADDAERVCQARP